MTESEFKSPPQLLDAKIKGMYVRQGWEGTPVGSRPLLCAMC